MKLCATLILLMLCCKFTIVVAAAPSNDFCQNASQVFVPADGSAIQETFLLAEATASGAASTCGLNFFFDGYYLVIAPAAGTIEVNTFNSQEDTTLAVYVGATCQTDQFDTSLDCNDDKNSLLTSAVTFVASSAGEQFLVRVGLYDSFTTYNETRIDFIFKANTTNDGPINAVCSQATLLDTLSEGVFSVEFDPSGIIATDDVCLDNSNAVYYRIVAPTPGTITVDMCGLNTGGSLVISDSCKNIQTASCSSEECFGIGGPVTTFTSTQDNQEFLIKAIISTDYAGNTVLVRIEYQPVSSVGECQISSQTCADCNCEATQCPNAPTGFTYVCEQTCTNPSKFERRLVETDGLVSYLVSNGSSFVTGSYPLFNCLCEQL